MVKCSLIGCIHEAEWAPKINVPAQGWPTSQHQQVTSIINLPLCTEHSKTLLIEEFLTDQLKKRFKEITQGKQPPDFNRAWISKVLHDSPEFKDAFSEKK